MVEHQPSKLNTWVRFPSPAFFMQSRKLRDFPVKSITPLAANTLVMTAFGATFLKGKFSLQSTEIYATISKV